MAGNDKPNLSDLKARLSLKQKEKSSPPSSFQKDPSPSRTAAPSQGNANASRPPFAQGEPQRQQTPGAPSPNMWEDEASFGHFQQPNNVRSTGHTSQNVGVSQGSAHPTASNPAVGQGQTQGQVPRSTTGHSAPQASNPQPVSPQANRGGRAAQQGPPAGFSGQPAGSGPAASKSPKSSGGGGLKDLQASFESNQSAFLPPSSSTVHDIHEPKLLNTVGIIVAVVAFVLGIIIASMYSVGSQKRQLFKFQIQDANEAYEVLNPKVSQFNELKTLVNSMDLRNPDFEQIEKLQSFKVVPETSPFSGERVLLGATIVSPIIRFLTDTSAIQSMLDEHIQITLADKDELNSLTGDSVIGKYNYFGIVFDYERTCNDGKKSNYVPGFGSLVGVPNPEPNEEGQYDARFVSNGNERSVERRFLIPLRKQELIVAQGAGNPLDLYSKRLEALKRRINSVDYTSTMLESIERVAKTPEPGLFSF